MKKLTLLLISSLLLLGACTNKGNSEKPSSGGQESSGNQSSVEPSSSEEPLDFPTIEGLIKAFQDNSFKLTISSANYDYTWDSGTNPSWQTFQVYKDGPADAMKVAYAIEHWESSGYYYVPEYFAEVINDHYYEYVEVNGFMVRKEGVQSSEIEHAFDALEMVYDFFVDVRDGEKYNWNYDEVNHTYHVEQHDEHDDEIDIELCLGFFSALNYTRYEGTDCYLTRIEATDYKNTIVKLPESKVDDIFDSMYQMKRHFDHMDSVTMDRVMTLDNGDQYTAKFLYKQENDGARQTIKCYLNGATTATYYRYERIDDTDYYSTKVGNGAWSESTESDFENAFAPIYEPNYFLNCPFPDALAYALVSIDNYGSNMFTVTMQSGMETRDVITCHFTDEGELTSYQLYEGETKVTKSLTFSDWNNTVVL